MGDVGDVVDDEETSVGWKPNSNSANSAWQGARQAAIKPTCLFALKHVTVPRV